MINPGLRVSITLSSTLAVLNKGERKDLIHFILIPIILILLLLHITAVIQNCQKERIHSTFHLANNSFHMCYRCDVSADTKPSFG